MDSLTCSVYYLYSSCALAWFCIPGTDSGIMKTYASRLQCYVIVCGLLLFLFLKTVPVIVTLFYTFSQLKALKMNG